MPNTCTVTGLISDIFAGALGELTVEFKTTKRNTYRSGDDVVSTKRLRAETDENGSLSVDLVPGEYVMTLFTNSRQYDEAKIIVPDAPVATLAQLIMGDPPANLDDAALAVIDARTARDDANASASSAATSAANASADAITANTQAGIATAQATASATSAAEASVLRSGIEAHIDAAEVSRIAAELAQTSAETAETNAAASEAGVAADAATATAQASISTSQASIATTQAGIATTAATNAGTSETNAAASAGTAFTDAATSTAQAGIATTKATEASASAAAAAIDATTATTKASEASASTTTATTQAGIATTAATNAGTSETLAEAAKVASEAAKVAAQLAATTASSHQTAAESAQTAAELAKTNAEAAQAITVSARDTVLSKFIGNYADDTAANASGYTVTEGVFYWNTTSKNLRIHDGTNWSSAVLDANGAMFSTNNLSDLANAATARTNLGLGTAAPLNVPATGNAAVGEVVKGDDTRLTNSRAPTAHTHPTSQVTGLDAALALKAPLASPALTGVPTAPTAVSTTNTTQIASTAFVKAVVADLVDGAPGAIDTLNELAAALGGDANFAATTATTLSEKLVKTANLSDLTSVPTARTNLGINTDNLPTILPTLNLDFANIPDIDSRLTFTRASTATYYDEFGVLQTAPVDTLRFDYDPVTGERLGVLIEEQRTNLLTYSEQFDNGAWSKSGASVSPDAITAPNGTSTADKLVEDSATSLHRIWQSYASAVLGEFHTVSCYAKAAERNRLRIEQFRGTNTCVVHFDLDTLTISLNESNLAIDPLIEDVGGGWYKCSFVFEVLATGTITTYIYGLAGTANLWAGDGTSGIYLWGAQLEAGSFPTSYIKTEASQVTRSADNLSITGTNFTDFYNQSEGTFVAQGSEGGMSGNSEIPVFQTDGGSQNIAPYFRVGLVLDGSYSVRVLSSTGPSTPINYDLNGPDQFLFTFAYDDTNQTVTTAGQTPVSGAHGGLAAMTRLIIGAGAFYPNTGVHVSRLTYYPRRLTNAQLQALTEV